MKVRKEIIPPGVYTYLHGKTGKPSKLTVTPEHVSHYAKQGNAMIAAGLGIPVPLEHQPDAVPMTAADRAAWQTKHNTGWVDKFEEEGGKLFGVLDIADPDIAKKLPHTIKFVSPHINSFLDGNGRQWDNVITHVALTTRPRITNQEPFAANLSAALSHIGALPNQTPQTACVGGVSISAACLLNPEGKPVYPMAFSLATGIRLAAEEVDEIIEEPDGDEAEVVGDVAPEADVASTGSDIPDLDGDGDGDSGDLAIEEAIMHLLKVLGHNPPPMNKATFKRDLYETLMVALQDKVKAADATPDEPDPLLGSDKDDMMDTADAPVIQEQPNMFASLEEIRQKVKSREGRRMAEWAFRLQQEKDKAESRANAAALSLVADAQRQQDSRINRILQSIPKTRRNAVKSRLDAMRTAPGAALSLGDNGKVIDPIESALALLEAGLPEMPAVLTEDRSSFVKQPQPKDGTMSQERREEILSKLV